MIDYTTLTQKFEYSPVILYTPTNEDDDNFTLPEYRLLQSTERQCLDLMQQQKLWLEDMTTDFEDSVLDKIILECLNSPNINN
jgi:hypothetical protein